MWKKFETNYTEETPNRKPMIGMLTGCKYEH